MSFYFVYRIRTIYGIGNECLHMKMPFKMVIINRISRKNHLRANNRKILLCDLLALCETMIFDNDHIVCGVCSVFGGVRFDFLFYSFYADISLFGLSFN